MGEKKVVVSPLGDKEVNLKTVEVAEAQPEQLQEQAPLEFELPPVHEVHV